eukprot:scaffold2557_cov139-Skeletonema_marinoi.AAC.2
MKELSAITNWTSSGHLRRCSMADAHIKSLSSSISTFYTIVTNHNGPPEAFDYSVRSARYDMVLECCWLRSQIGPHQVTYDAVARLMHI